MATSVMAAQRKGLLCSFLLIAVLHNALTETVERYAPEHCDDTNPCPNGLACVPTSSVCIPADNLLTIFETNYVLLPIHPMSNHGSSVSKNYEQSNKANQASRRIKRKVSSLPELLREIPKKDLESEDNKLAQEIKAVQKVENTLKSDLDHLPPSRHHHSEKHELETELKTMVTLENELRHQEEMIEERLDKSESDYSDSYKETTGENEFDNDAIETGTDKYDYSEDSFDYTYDSSKDYDTSDESTSYSDDEEWSQEYDDSESDYEESYDDSQEDYSDSPTRYKRSTHRKPHAVRPGEELSQKIKALKAKENELEEEIETLQGKLTSQTDKHHHEVHQPGGKKEYSVDRHSAKVNLEHPEKPSNVDHVHTKGQSAKPIHHSHSHDSHQKMNNPHQPHQTGIVSSDRDLSDQEPDMVGSLVDALSDTTGVKVQHIKGRTTKPDLDSLNMNSLEQIVLQDIQKAKTGLTVSEASRLQQEVEKLEDKEDSMVEDMIQNTDTDNSNLDDIEKRILLEQLLEDLLTKLDNQLTATKKSRPHRSLDVAEPLIETRADSLDTNKDGQIRSQRYASWVSALKDQRDKTVELVLTPENNGVTYHYRDGEKMEHPRDKRSQPGHHHRTHSHKATHHTHHSKVGGRKDLDRCDRCEAMVGEEVCGGNGKTYNSLCHAVNCAGLNENDIAAGVCSQDDVCESNDCVGDNKECVALTEGVCLSIYSNVPSKRLTCRQYMCVSEGHCTSDSHSHVCGLNGKTYPSLCYLHKASIQLAYSGMCRPKLCRNSVCGRNGVTYTSSCHARAHGVRVDYPGECFAESVYPKFHGCSDVVKAGRCPKLTCNDPVLPKDSCCPVCGGALIVHPDTKAMVALLSTWKDVNHLYVVENFLRKLLSKSASKSCELSATLTNSGNVSVVLEAVDSTDHNVCKAGSKDLVRAINSHSPEVEDSMLSPMAKTAAMINPFNPMDSVNKFMLNTQDKMLDLPNKAQGKLNEGLTYADRKTTRLENQHASNSSHAVCVSIITATLLVLCSIVHNML